MPYITATLRFTSDVGGQPAVVFERTHRVFLTEAQMLSISKSGSDGVGVYSTIPTIDKLPILNAVVIATDTPVNLKFASVGAADGIIALKAGGLVAIIDGAIGAGASLNALVNNVGATAANLSGIAGGT